MFTLHNGDCLEYMKTLQPASVDCVITDPPYILNNGNGSGGFLKKTSITHRLNFIENGFDSAAWFAEVKRVSKKMNCFIFCSNNQVAELLEMGSEYITTLLVWHKPNVPPFSNGTWLQDVEFIVHIRESGATFKGETKLKKKVVTLPKEIHETEHPAEKPVALIKRYLQIGTNEGDIVLDTYMGSGTVGVAALQLGRSFIGIELLPEYFAMAEKRIKQSVLQQSFFTPSNNRLQPTAFGVGTQAQFPLLGGSQAEEPSATHGGG